MTSFRPLNLSSLKLQLATSAQVNTDDISGLIKQVIKGSKSGETLNQVHREFASTDTSIVKSLETFQKLSAVVNQLSEQQELINRNVRQTKVVVEQLNIIEKQTHELLKSGQ